MQAVRLNWEKMGVSLFRPQMCYIHLEMGLFAFLVVTALYHVAQGLCTFQVLLIVVPVLTLIKIFPPSPA